MIRLINALLAIAGGLIGAWVLFFILNKLVELLPTKWEERLKPWAFIGPAVAAIGFFLIYLKNLWKGLGSANTETN
jgi:alpha-glucoside transport system permease protein